MRTLISALGNIKDQTQVNQIAQTLYGSGILKDTTKIESRFSFISLAGIISPFVISRMRILAFLCGKNQCHQELELMDKTCEWFLHNIIDDKTKVIIFCPRYCISISIQFDPF
jgi:hypothetical protein